MSSKIQVSGKSIEFEIADSNEDNSFKIESAKNFLEDLIKKLKLDINKVVIDGVVQVYTVQKKSAAGSAELYCSVMNSYSDCLCRVEHNCAGEKKDIFSIYTLNIR